jgi:cytoskeletal protein RodZ
MTKAGFGQHLKREREMRGVSLDEICSATRISVRFLEALESEDWERLPGGVFNRGFVRAVSRYLGLDEEAMVAEYVLAIHHGVPPVPSLSAATADPGRDARKRWLRAGVACAVALVLAVVGCLGWRFFSARSGAQAVAGSAALAANGAPSVPSLPHSGPAPASQPLILDKLELKVEAGKGTTMSVAADGNNVFEGTMIAGQTRHFEAQNQLDISAEDAGALVLQLNGRMLPPIGPPGGPGRVTLTRRDLALAEGGAD